MDDSWVLRFRFLGPSWRPFFLPWVQVSAPRTHGPMVRPKCTMDFRGSSKVRQGRSRNYRKEKMMLFILLWVTQSQHPCRHLRLAWVGRNAAGQLQRWEIGGWGRIVYDAKNDSLGAHCTIGNHGLCRANKVCKRLGLGYLVAWLRESHTRTKDAFYETNKKFQKLDSHQKHKDFQSCLCSPDGYHLRLSARQWLLDRQGAFQDLLDLEEVQSINGGASQGS